MYGASNQAAQFAKSYRSEQIRAAEQPRTARSTTHRARRAARAMLRGGLH
jgi:hypothetical protein